MSSWDRFPSESGSGDMSRIGMTLRPASRVEESNALLTFPPLRDRGVSRDPLRGRVSMIFQDPLTVNARKADTVSVLKNRKRFLKGGVPVQWDPGKKDAHGKKKGNTLLKRSLSSINASRTISARKNSRQLLHDTA